jgi:hypothetical protein
MGVGKEHVEAGKSGPIVQDEWHKDLKQMGRLA